MALNPYINSFETQEAYEEYIEGSTAKAPNVAYIRATDEMKYTKTIPNPTWIIYGTTTGTEDFYIGASARYVYSSANNGIHMHVDGGRFYATAEDVVGTISVFFDDYSGFNTTEGHKITKIKRWTYQNADVTDMYSMFYGCENLTSLDISGFDTTNVTRMSYMFQNCTSLNKLILGHGFFNSTSLSTFDFSQLSAWTDADSLETFVQAAEVHDGTGKRLILSSQSLNALTQAQKDRITGAGWTIG